jgi:hypothetical protein
MKMIITSLALLVFAAPSLFAAGKVVLRAGHFSTITRAAPDLSRLFETP